MEKERPQASGLGQNWVEGVFKHIPGYDFLLFQAANTVVLIHFINTYLTLEHNIYVNIRFSEQKSRLVGRNF